MCIIIILIIIYLYTCGFSLKCSIHTHRCANTGLGDVVSELLSALLNRLTELEQHEKELRACQSLVDEVKQQILSEVETMLFFLINLYTCRLN